MSEEGSSSLGDCYIPSYHLSEQYTYGMYVKDRNNISAPHFNGIKENDKENVTVFFNDHTLVNWGMFAAPRHPLFKATLTNIVDIITTEYLRQSVVHMTRWDKKWKQVMCTTGFVLTYTLRELELQTALLAEDIPRILSNNFKIYKGNVKAFWTGGDSSHYMKLMIRQNLHILKETAPVSLDRIISFLNGRAVMGDQGRSIYLVKDGKKYTFGSYETFLKMGFTDRSTRHVADTILAQIPDGGEVSAAGLDTRSHNAHTFTGVISSPDSRPTEEIQPSPPTSPSSPSLSSTSPSALILLQNVSRIIADRNNSECFSDDYGGSRDDFLKDKYRDLIGDHSVMIHPVCMTTYQLGNTFGYFINDIACADMAGAHFLAIKQKFQILHPHTLDVPLHDLQKQLAFFQALPIIRVHNQSQSMEASKKIMRERCHCLQFCWENSEAPWISRVPLIREVLEPAVQAYTLAVGGMQNHYTKLSNETDRLYLSPALQRQYGIDYRQNKEFKITPTIQSAVKLPLVPNVTIQYRCGDNIGFGKTKYGLLPYSVYGPKRITLHSLQAKQPLYIYIIADSPQRNSAHVYSYRCETILDRLVAYLVRLYPNSVIALKRGGDIFLDYTRIMYSNIVFCSASTFCLWPALANDVGQVYYPLTPLIAKAATNETAPKFKENFHWIGEVEMIKQFKHYRPWTRLIDELETIGS